MILKISKCILLISIVMLMILSCKTTPVDPYDAPNEEFLSKSGNESFRIVMMSDRYLVRQKKYEDSFSRVEDTSGDEYFMERLKRMDLVDAAREGEVRVWVYPDSGRLMKIRFVESSYIEEIDKLIIDDVQRWTLRFSRGIYPRNFTVRYRVVLRKGVSNSEIRRQINDQDS
jgi:hypothetical protein